MPAPTARSLASLSRIGPGARAGAVRGGRADPQLAAERQSGHFVRTTKYAEVPSRKGHEPALFGIFVDPVHCKGCGECVEVCHALGYDALHMIDKLPEERTPADPRWIASPAISACSDRCR